MSFFYIHSDGSVHPRTPRYFSNGMAAICSLLRPEFIIRAQPPSAFWPVTASEGRMRFIKGSPASKRRAFSRMMAMVAACRSGTWGVQWGVMYTVGSVLYGLGCRKRYIHSVFHLFCLLGTFFHFWGIYQYLIIR